MEANNQRPDDTRRTASRSEQLSLFARNFFKHPKMLGSIIPSSPFLVRRMLDQVDWPRARLLVEYGPGIGTFTREILQQMHPDATLVALETNEDFVRFLNYSFDDPRLQVVHGSAENIQQILQERGLGQADYVIAGIPFSTLTSEIKASILRATRQVIEANGAFLLYQFSPRLLPDLRNAFSVVNRHFEPFNFLPAHCYYCTP